MNAQASYFFVGQFQHLLLLACLLPGVLFLASRSLDNTLWMGVSGKTLFYSLLLIIVLQQVIGWPRDLSRDQFRHKYREMPIVNQGAFRYSSNAMYTFAFFAFWAVALLAGSTAAIAVALFQHAYIWVHWYCTEEPDIRVIYGS